MDLMPLDCTLKSHFSVFNMAEEQTFEVGSTLVSLAVGQYNDVLFELPS
jgi:hypothetical protein